MCIFRYKCTYASDASILCVVTHVYSKERVAVQRTLFISSAGQLVQEDGTHTMTKPGTTEC